MKIAFAERGRPKSGTIVVGVTEDRTLTPTAAALDKESGGALKRAMESSRFTGRKDEALGVLAPAKLDVGRVLLIGVGKASAVDAAAMQSLGGQVVAQLNTAGEKAAAVALDDLDGAKIEGGAAAANFAYGARLRAYRFDKYRTKEKPEQKATLEKLTVMTRDVGEANRDLVSEPANIIYPETIAEAARSLEKLEVDVEVLDEKQMKKLGMGALLGVGQGSDKPPRLVVMQWKGAKSKTATPVAFIGKGVTFDTGGISIKPADGMWDMKWDMAGAGVVIGLMKALAGRKAKVNVVGVVGLVENMPSGQAQRPGDIVTSMSGQTIDVLNPDAQGRLPLADAMWYAQDRFKLKFMVHFATLTVAIITALGHA